MNTADFLKAVLPDGGHYFVYHIQNSGRLTETVHSGIEEAHEAINKGITGNKDVYVALSSFKEPAGRTQDNAAYKRVFFADLDCGEGKDYPDKRAAIDALKQFLTEAEFLDPSLVVSSGNGIHVYWVMDEDIAAVKWTTMATALKTLFKVYGFKADPACTADSARIVRVPGSYNYKNRANPQECKVLLDNDNAYPPKDFLAKLREYQATGHADPKVTSLAEKFRGESNDDLDGGAHVPRYFKELVKECRTMAHILETGGATCGEQLWKDTLNTLVFCEDGEKYVHSVGRSHAGYSHRSTELKWRQRLAAKDAGQLVGPPTCDTIHENACDTCEGCPHWKDPLRNQPQGFKSPMKFAAKPSENDVPHPYSRANDGMVMRVKTDDGWEVNKILDYRITDMRVFKEVGVDTTISCIFERGNRQHHAEFSTQILSSPRELTAGLSKFGVMVQDLEVKGLKHLMKSWVKQIEDRGQAQTVVNNLGWSDWGANKAFAIGETLYTQDGPITIKRLDDKIYVPSGDEARWRQLASKALEAGHVETEIIIASAFASPLLEFTPISGGILSAVSTKSGTGKTTALKLAQAVWGHPIKGIHVLQDTMNAIMKKTGLAGSMPSLWDEVRVTDDKKSRDVVETIYQITQGREKARMNADTSLNEGVTWRTLMVCCSNLGIQDHIRHIDEQTDAGMYRVMEFDVSPLDPTKACPQTEFMDVDKHYGHIGPQYADYLARNAAKVNEAVSGMYIKVQDRLQAPAEARFIVGMAAAVIVGAQLAKKLGFVDFDTNAITQFMLENAQKAIAAATNVRDNEDSVTNPIGLLKVFLQEHNELGIVSSVVSPGSRHELNKQKLIPANNRAPMWHMGEEDHTLRVSKSALMKWAYGKIKQRELLEALQAMGAEVGKKRLGQGILPSCPNIACIDLPLNDHTADLFTYDEPA